MVGAGIIGFTVTRIVETIQEIFEVSAELAEQDVVAFVQSLLDEDLVVIVSGS